MDGGEGVDGAAHHEVEEARVGAVERGGEVAGGALVLLLIQVLVLLVGEWGRRGVDGDGKAEGEAEKGEEEEGDEDDGGDGVGGGGEECAAPQERPARVHGDGDGDERRLDLVRSGSGCVCFLRTDSFFFRGKVLLVSWPPGRATVQV
jgi:hypothetical protein